MFPHLYQSSMPAHAEVNPWSDAQSSTHSMDMTPLLPQQTSIHQPHSIDNTADNEFFSFNQLNTSADMDELSISSPNIDNLLYHLINISLARQQFSQQLQQKNGELARHHSLTYQYQQEIAQLQQQLHQSHTTINYGATVPDPSTSHVYISSSPSYNNLPYPQQHTQSPLAHQTFQSVAFDNDPPLDSPTMTSDTGEFNICLQHEALDWWDNLPDKTSFAAVQHAFPAHCGTSTVSPEKALLDLSNMKQGNEAMQTFGPRLQSLINHTD
ncbi:hypothetical protein BDC45DRAFT_531984 [Circinella umbellata]|nr:hypothetical protein BDC45DRAFT_531984 [Circinella umbellata]